MPETPVVKIETLDDLKKVLFIQRQITRKAHDELEAVASDNLLDADSDPIKVKKYMKEEAELLASYAKRPTLTEWCREGGMEHGGFYSGLYDGAPSWGATFGVAILTSELVLEQVRQMHPQFSPAIKGILIALLTAETQMKGSMDDNEFQNLVMNFNVAKPDGSPIENEKTKESLRVALTDVVQTLVATGIEYGLFEERENGSHMITDIGTRVLFHMQDVQKFITAMGEAHQRFQNEAPALMTSFTESPPPRRKRRINPNKSNS